MRSPLLMALMALTVTFYGLQTLAEPFTDLPAEIEQRLDAYQAAYQTLMATKPDLDQLKKIEDYYKLSDADHAELDAAMQAIQNLSTSQWRQLMAHSLLQGRQMFNQALVATSEEIPSSRPSYVVNPATLPAPLTLGGGDYIDTQGGVVYAKHVPNPNSGGSPLILGGGFPFNQTQFEDFNKQVAQIASLDLYDPVCTGLAVLYDKLQNNGDGCRPYHPQSLQLVQDEMAYQFAYTLITLAQVMGGLTPDQADTAIFRLTRISFKGVSLVQQTQALAAIADQQGYRDGEALFVGLSYGGILGGKMGIMYPGRFKALVLFSPGVENPAHIGVNKDLSAVLEGSYVQRRVLRNIVHDIAFSPRYDAYLPQVLKDYDSAFRESLQAKLLGELDLDLRSDLDKVSDRVYMVTGAMDASINPKSQIDAMRHVFKKSLKGSYILVPKGGHALWGNPDQSAEDAVLRILREIELGEKGAFKDGGVYYWNGSDFTSLGVGLDGLAAAEAMVTKLTAPAPVESSKK